ncbi:glycosyl hydrolase [Kitasatospora sp. NPDC057198]|uniref:glycosyl hydrolase n=1 Tax=Kitasatospora sp. NPDC057198 TaxID=3346046 RepID=UPI003630A814
MTAEFAPGLDLGLADLHPVDHTSAELAEALHDEFELLVRHDSGAGRSHVLAFDAGAVWVMPGAENLAAFDVVRHLEQGTFRLRQSKHANVAFAQKWLVDRGCPPEALRLDRLLPADERTRRVEERIHGSGDRYEVRDSFAMEGDDNRAWTMVVDREAAALPVRLFVEELLPDRKTYTLREGAFPDEDAAWEWCLREPGPLPPAPEDRSPEAERIRASLARSSAPATPGTGGAVPVAGVVAQPGRGRSL